MGRFAQLSPVRPGDKVAVLSPSFAAPGKFPDVFELGMKRMRDIFNIEPIEFPTTRKIGSSVQERGADLIAAFENPDIKAVFASIGGDDQDTYVYTLPSEPFVHNPKPFFGYSDNTHFENFLWKHNIPSYYGGSIMTQFAMQNQMDAYTIEYLQYALFEQGIHELHAAKTFTDIGLDWGDKENLGRLRTHEINEGWYWDGGGSVEGITWGGCVESIDKMFENNQIPSIKSLDEIILLLETAEDIPSAVYVADVLNKLGERGVLERAHGFLIGRPKSWEFDQPHSLDERIRYREEQRTIIIKTIRRYNDHAPIVQNLDFGHTDPQIPFPYGKNTRIDTSTKKVCAEF